MCIFVTCIWWWNISNHHSSAITTQGVLKKSSQLRVSEWNIILLVLWVVFMKHIDTITKSKKWSVYISTLYHPNASVIGLWGSFRTSEINQWQLSYSKFSFDTSISIFVLANDLEYSVRSGWCLISTCGLYLSISVSESISII
jgi:hypothetical protein